MDPNLVGPSRCGHLGCSKRPTYGIEDSAGSKRAQFCAPHAKPGMVNVSRRRCAHVGCMRHPSFAIKGNKSLLFCLQHSTDEMVDIHNVRRCGHEGCVKHPTYGVPGTRRAEFCAPHALDGMVSGELRVEVSWAVSCWLTLAAHQHQLKNLTPSSRKTGEPRK